MRPVRLALLFVVAGGFCSLRACQEIQIAGVAKESSHPVTLAELEEHGNPEFLFV